MVGFKATMKYLSEEPSTVGCEPRMVGTFRFHLWCPHPVKIRCMLSIWCQSGVLSSVRGPNTASLAWPEPNHPLRWGGSPTLEPAGQPVLFLKPWLVNVHEASVPRVLITSLSTYHFSVSYQQFIHCVQKTKYFVRPCGPHLQHSRCGFPLLGLLTHPFSPVVWSWPFEVLLLLV